LSLFFGFIEKMSCNVITSATSDALILETIVFGDRRGFFFERFIQRDFNQVAGLIVNFVQDNHKQFWVPPGFAFGFVVLSDKANFHYITTDHYTPEHELSDQVGLTFDHDEFFT